MKARKEARLDRRYDTRHVLYRKVLGERVLIHGFNMLTGEMFYIDGQASELFTRLDEGMTAREALMATQLAGSANERKTLGFLEQMCRLRILL